MKLYLLVCFFAASMMQVMATQELKTTRKLRNMYDKAIESALERVQHDALQKFKERLRHAPMVEQDSHSSNESCNCTEECDKLHVSRLPHDVRDVDKYLSYENFPVLCRDAAAVILPPAGENEPQKKYVCKQVFDCCRRCNQGFYTCLKTPGVMYTYGFCMRGAYTCMCDCIENKSFKELPDKP